MGVSKPMTAGNVGTERIFSIAGLRFCVRFAEGQTNSIGLVPPLVVFEAGADGTAPMLWFDVDDTVKPVSGAVLLRTFATGNGDTLVFTTENPQGYQFVIRDLKGRDCCLLVADKDFSHCRCALNGTQTMRAFGLNNALMLAYAYAACRHDALLLHASCTVCDGKAYAFTARSGTGKSTHTGLWMAHVEGTELLNDDNPVVRVVGGRPMAFGSPWSGKTPCYRNASAPLGAVVKIERAEANRVEKSTPTAAFATLLASCSMMKWDRDINECVCRTIEAIVETTPVYVLHCLPNKEAAVVCHQQIAG